MPSLRLLEVSGTPFEMGRQHAAAYPKEIQELAEDRLRLSSHKDWTGKELSRQAVLALGQACLPYHETYAPELMDELRGLSAGTGLGVTELMILNGFTDFVDTIYCADEQQLRKLPGTPGNSRERSISQSFHQLPTVPTAVPAHPAADACTAFIVSSEAAADGQGFLGQTWDMHETATPYLILLRGKPEGGLRFLAFTIIGCIGMIGMNEAGIAVGINNLVAGDGRPGVTWPFVVRKVLAQDNLVDALTCITQAQLAGGHNYLLADSTGRGYNVEAMASRCHVEEVKTGAWVHTNHCLIAQNIEVERARLPRSRASSETRLSRGEELLNQREITWADLMSLTRDHGAVNGICVHPEEPFYLESCGAAIMRPATREFRAVWGRPCENEYESFVV
jgi:isopenicillin-N N-acyltransferase-like protein